MKLTSLFLALLVSCSPKAQDSTMKNNLNIEFSFPKKLKEVSGMVLSKDQKILWSIEDAGNKNMMYGVDFQGNIVSEVVIENTENIDWEDMTKDEYGNIYIGDFGNNENDRKDLFIIKLDFKEDHQKKSKVVQTTKFYYEGQTEFPPKKSNLLYDCEAFVEKDGHFYLFTKNRSKGFDGTFLVFQVPNKKGYFQAKLMGKFKLKGSYDDAAITSAAINSKNEIALLTHKNIHLLSGFKPTDLESVIIKKIPFDHNSQKEAVVFMNDNTLLIADEKKKKQGGNVYKFSLK